MPARAELLPLRVEAAAAGVLLMATYVVWGFLRPYAAGTLDDDGVYITVGKALATGQGYRNIHLVGEPPNTNYPPGVPLLFALVWKLAGNLAAVQQTIAVVNLIACGVSAGVLWFIARARLQLTRIVTLLFVIAPLLLDISFQHYKLALSEPYFLLGWSLLLLLYYQVRAELAERRALAWAALLGCAALLLVGVRLQAIGLIPAVLIALVFEHRRANVVAAALSGLMLPIVIMLLLSGDPLGVAERLASAPHFAWLSAGGAAESISFGLRAAGTNFMLYQLRLVQHLSSARILGAILLTIAQILVLAGTIYLLRRHAALALTLVAAITVTLIWPFNDLRLLVVMLPFAGMVAASGVDLLVRSGSSRRRYIVVVVLAVLALPILVRQLQFRFDARNPAATAVAPGAFSLARALQRQSAMIVATSDWVLAHTSQEDHVMVAHTAGVHLRTGRSAVESNPPQSLFLDVGPAPFARPGRFLASIILSEYVTVLVLERPGQRIGADAQIISQLCPNVLEMWEGDRADVYPVHYRVTRDEPCLRSLLQDAPRE